MSLNLILGCMFSGKTTELLRRFKRYTIGNMKCLMIKFRGDTRYDKDNVVTHCGKAIPATVVQYLYEVDSIVNSYDVICIDEIQFYPDAHIFCDKWANQGKIVEASGINGTFHKTPFPIISKLVPQASNITFLTAICKENGKDAIYSFKHTSEHGTDADVDIGGAEKYTALDRATYNKYTSSQDLYDKFVEFCKLFNECNKLDKVYDVKRGDIEAGVPFTKLIDGENIEIKK